MGWRGAGVGEGNEPPEHLAELQSIEELNEAHQTAEGRDRLERGGQKELAGAQNGVQCPLHRVGAWSSGACLFALLSNHVPSAKRCLL